MARSAVFLAPFILGLATWAAYFRSVEAPFIFDDRPAIERNASIRQLWPISGPLNPPVTAAGAAGRPIVNLSLALNYAVGGLQPRGYHVLNVVLHWLAGLALYGVVRRTLGAGNSFSPLRGWREDSRLDLPVVPAVPALTRRATGIVPGLTGGAAGFAIALLWLVHPLQTESVVGVIQRNEILVALFLLLTLYAFSRFATPGEPRWWGLVAVFACTLGMASKEVMVAAPIIVLLYDRTFVSGTFRAAWQRHRGIHFSLAATWLLLGWLLVQNQQRAGTVGFGLGMSSWEYLLTQCRAIATYLKLSVWPHPLVVDYGVEAVKGPAEVWAQGLLVIGLLGATVMALHRRLVAGFLGACFFLLLAPSSSFVPLTTQTIAEHRMYLSLAAAIALIVGGVGEIWRRGAPAAVAGQAAARTPRRHRMLLGLVAVTLIVLTAQRVSDYRSEIALWTDTVGQRPENARAHASLAGAYVRAERWAEAVPHFETALQRRPDYVDAHNDYANVLARLGRREEAIDHYEAALRLKPGDTTIRFNLAAALNQAGVVAASASRTREALERFEAAARLDPGNVEVLSNLGDALLQSGRAAEAATRYAAAARLKPEVPEVRYNYGGVLLQLNRMEEAVQEYAAALRGRPDWAAAHHNLALTLVRAGRPGEAVAHYEEVLRQMPESAQAHHNFALALEALGRTAEAIAQDEAALRLQPGFAEARRHLERLRGR